MGIFTLKFNFGNSPTFCIRAWYCPKRVPNSHEGPQFPMSVPKVAYTYYSKFVVKMCFHTYCMLIGNQFELFL
jgi:hypothetical protein